MMNFKTFFRLLRWLVVPVVLVLCVWNIEAVWYFKAAIIFFVISASINDWRIGAYREEARKYRKW